MAFWKRIIHILVFVNVVGAILFTAHPRRVQLHGNSPTPFLRLICHFNSSDDVTRIYEIEVGREVKGRAIPIARLTSSGATGTCFWKCQRVHISGEVSTELGSSFLDVKLMELTCPDVTSYYCLAYYGTSGKIGVISDKVQEDVKATGVSMEVTPNSTTDNPPFVNVNCTFLHPGTSLYQIQIGTKTVTSETLLVTANETGISLLNAKTQILESSYSFGTNSTVESWAAVAILQDACDVTYFCKAIYVSRNVTETDEDSKEIRMSCRNNISRHKNSVTNPVRPRNRDPHTSTHDTSGADRRRVVSSLVLSLLVMQRILIDNQF